MTRKEIIERVIKLVSPMVTEEGFELWQVDYYKDPTGFNLLIEIDRDEKISFDDLSVINKRINDALDKADFIADSYSLEVSSAGLERELKTKEHLNKFLGTDTTIVVKLYAPKDDSKQFEGKLISFDDDSIELLCGNEEKKISFKEAASIKAELTLTEDISE